VFEKETIMKWDQISDRWVAMTQRLSGDKMVGLPVPGTTPGVRTQSAADSLAAMERTGAAAFGDDRSQASDQ